MHIQNQNLIITQSQKAIPRDLTQHYEYFLYCTFECECALNINDRKIRNIKPLIFYEFF